MLHRILNIDILKYQTYSQHKHKQLLSRNMTASRCNVIKKNRQTAQPTVYSFINHTKNTENCERSVASYSELIKGVHQFQNVRRFHSECVKVAAFETTRTARPSLSRHSRNSRILTALSAGSLTPNFIINGHSIWKVRIEIRLRP